MNTEQTILQVCERVFTNEEFQYVLGDDRNKKKNNNIDSTDLDFTNLIMQNLQRENGNARLAAAVLSAEQEIKQHIGFDVELDVRALGGRRSYEMRAAISECIASKQVKGLPKQGKAKLYGA